MVKIVGYNFFILGDFDDLGILMAVFEMEVYNFIGQDMEVAIVGSICNFIGKDGREYIIDWKGDYILIGVKSNVNIYWIVDGFLGIFMYFNDVDIFYLAWGIMALIIFVLMDQVSYWISFVKNVWNCGIFDFWDDFSVDGMLMEKIVFVDFDFMVFLVVKQVVLVG